MAVNSNSVFAEEDIDRVVKKLNQSKRIVKNSVMPVEDIDRVVKKLNQSKRIVKNEVLPRLNPPKTGQTTSYAIGDDGDLQKGAAWPSPRFTANVDNNGDGDCTDPGETCDGTVTDNQTKLIWLKNADCYGQRTWTEALNDCNTLADGNCGLTDWSVAGDWRLPNIRELHSLIHYGFYEPALPDTAGTGQWTDGDAFTNVVSYDYYWSATTYAFVTDGAWIVHMGYGSVLSVYKSSYLYVWPVRAGQ
jgi:hypothetical protein